MTVIRAVLAVLMIGGAVALAALAPVQNGGQAAVKLEAARQVELVDGDLNKAIGLYLEIVKGFPLEREVAAKALLHMGQSYEKIGKKDNAREAYSQILARYGSQTRIAAAARSALARFADNGPDAGAATTASSASQRWRPSSTPAAGNLLILNDLTVRDNRSGQARSLSTSNQNNALPLFSPNGQQVAYVSWTQVSSPSGIGSPTRLSQLRVANVNGPPNDRALTNFKDVNWLVPYEWAPDGSEVLTVLERGDSTNQIALVSVADGSTRILKSLEWRYPESVSFDGRNVAYTLQARPGQRDVFLIATGGVRGTPKPEFRYTIGASSQVRAPLSTDREAIHVLNRLGFGPRPGDIERVKAMGIDAYIAQQLYPEKIADRVVEDKLSTLKSLKMTSEQIMGLIDTHMAVPQVEARARVFERRRLMETAGSGRAANTSMEALRRASDAGQPATELRIARLVRAVYSERQLQEQMVDFWMNHFNIKFDNEFGAVAETAGSLDFEQNAIRPRTLGRFEDLLTTVAKHPAMLRYLDNRLNTAPADVIQKRIETLKPSMGVAEYLALRERKPFLDKAQGLNENYARELLELHTVGIDGGYTQQDIIEVAKILTGWTTTAWNRGDGMEEIGADGGRFVFDGLLHVEGDKTVMGQRISSAGINEGEQLLRMLARHPSTARFISTKLVRRFVADNPPAAIVDAAARTFERTGGDIREVLRTIFNSSGFRSTSVYGAKIKKPFELIVSSLRAVNARIDAPLPLTYDGMQRTAMTLIVSRGAGARGTPAITEKMGERLYTYEAPDGNPDVAAAWINSNALLARLEFANNLAMNRVNGLKADLPAAQAVLQQMGMPRPTAEQIEQTRVMMEALVNQPAVGQRGAAAPAPAPARGAGNAAPPPSPVTAEAVTVAAMLGSPQFQNR